jgi:pyrroline-5-carboxylate reductase
VNAPSIALLGGGNMGRALLGGLIRRGMPKDSLRVGEADAGARRTLEQDLGVRTYADNEGAVREADVILLAVKPQDTGAVLSALRPELARRPRLLISVAAGIEIRSLESWCGEGCAVVRAMPNRPALVGAGATGVYASSTVSVSQKELAEHILQAVGTVVWLKSESDLDVVTALSGSGPAYFFLLAELMMQSAVALGLEPAAARELAVATLHGAGVLAHASDADLARLRAEVTSKGGTTEAALGELAGPAGISPVVERALAAATRRSRELAAKFGGRE